MKKANVLKSLVLVSLVAVMVFQAGIGSAWSYFTTYARAEGGYPVSFGPDTEIEEEISNWQKTVRIRNKSGSVPVYVRVRAFCGAAYDLVFTDPDNKWEQGGDGYWYYKDIVNAGQDTAPLQIRINGVPADITDASAFNVVVVYEYNLAKYDKNGKPYADWSEGGK